MSITYTTLELTQIMDGYLYRCLVCNTKDNVSAELVASGTARLSYAGVRAVFVNPSWANDLVTINNGY